MDVYLVNVYNCGWSLLPIFEIDSKVYKFHNSDMKVKTRSHIIVNERVGLTALHRPETEESQLMLSQECRSEARIILTPIINNAGIFLMEYCRECSNTKSRGVSCSNVQINIKS